MRSRGFHSNAAIGYGEAQQAFGIPKRYFGVPGIGVLCDILQSFLRNPIKSQRNGGRYIVEWSFGAKRHANAG